MSWYIGFYLAIAMAVLAVVYLEYSSLENPKKQKIRALHIMLATCFCATLALSVPPYQALYASESLGGVKTVVLSIQKAISVFGIEDIYEVVEAAAPLAPESIREAYLLAALVIQFFAPLLTFGCLLSFFKNASAYARYFHAYFRDVFVFSALNPRSLALAGDILRTDGKRRVVFTNVSAKAEEAFPDLAEGAARLGAICFRKDSAGINFGLHSKKRERYFFEIGDDEIQNVRGALGLISSYNMRENTHLYIFSGSAEGELLLAGKEKGHMKVRRVDTAKSLISHILYKDGEKIFESAVGEEEREKTISAIIVGMGERGSEMLKALTWYCQMDGYRVKINAFDKDPLAEQRFSALCPELMGENYNDVYREGEAAYSVRIHAGCHVGSQAFMEKIKELKDATYVFISIGSDEANIQAAVDLRMYFERMGLSPVIQAVVGNSEVKKVLENAKNSAGQLYNIDCVGDIEACYSERVILDSVLEQDAFERHKAYCDGDAEREEDFWRYEYCYRSSMASAIHADARIKCHIPGAEKKETELTDSERETLGALEHRRWNAYMRAAGYIYSGSKAQASRNDLGKMHYDLVDYSELGKEKRKDALVGQKL